LKSSKSKGGIARKKAVSNHHRVKGSSTRPFILSMDSILVGPKPKSKK
jgi:hypothetical protein